MKKKIWYVLTTVLIVILLCFSIYYYKTKENLMDFDSDPVIIAHAMGGLDDAKYPNCLEAFETNYQNGARIFEADIVTTSDKVLVLRHDWKKDYGQNLNLENGNVPTYEEFMNAPIYGTYTPLSMKDVFELMKTHKDMYLITDTKKYKPKKVKAQFKQLVKAAEAANATKCLDHLVIQIYNDDMYDVVMSVYPFKQVIYTLYKRGTDNFEQLCQFCVEKNIKIITLDQKKYTDELQTIADQYNLKIFLHTVNKKKNAKKFYKKGVDGFYTDKLTSASFE